MTALALEEMRFGKCLPRQHVSVVCDRRTSPWCKLLWTTENHLRQEETDVCAPCKEDPAGPSRSLSEALFDGRIFEEIDDEAKAYVAGRLVGRKILVQDLFEEMGVPLEEMESLSDRALARRNLDKLLDVLARTSFSGLATDLLRWAFLRGCFDSRGSMHEDESLVCSFRLPIELEEFRRFVEIPCECEGDVVCFRGTNAVDFLGRLYEGAAIASVLYRKFFGECTSSIVVAPPVFRWAKLHPDAVAPTKGRASDAGYDVTVLSPREPIASSLAHMSVLASGGWAPEMPRLYRTGIQVSCAHGWYFDMVPRSSLWKTGYMLANSVGIIDASYRGEIFVPLIKITPEAPELELPARLVQLIPRPILHAEFVEDELDDTSRGSKGFGSSGR